MLEPTFTISAKAKRQESATFIIEPLEQGFGYTLGNALRRTMLDNLPGAAITQVKIKGIRHQFTTLKGMSNDIVELILNFKRIRLSCESKESETLYLSAQGPGQVKASQIKAPPTVKIINKDLILATLADKKTTLEVELSVEHGIGYSQAEDRKSDRIGVIPIDATFTPVSRVAYHVEATRVGRRTDLDRLIIHIETDGTITPKQALEQTAKLLVAYFTQVFEPKEQKKPEEHKIDTTKDSEIFNLTVEELDLPTRIANALRKGGYKTVRDLANAKETKLAQVKNLGEKSVQLIKKALKKKDVILK